MTTKTQAQTATERKEYTAKDIEKAMKEAAKAKEVTTGAPLYDAGMEEIAGKRLLFISVQKTRGKFDRRHNVYLADVADVVKGKPGVPYRALIDSGVCAELLDARIEAGWKAFIGDVEERQSAGGRTYYKIFPVIAK